MRSAARDGAEEVAREPNRPPCSACRAPGPHHYPPDPGLPLPGVWLCDSCVDPGLVRARLAREPRRYMRLSGHTQRIDDQRR